ncbi:DUF6541 family protein [Brachybacterium sp. UNK5269]|uniref:DUF6541 family protein n=1 Tax=Brachybacterium sp. UNK5269 TaxID=3408576 RepID=UPI003BAFF24A
MDALRVLAALGAGIVVLGGPGLPAVLALRLRPLTGVAAVVPLSLLLLTIAAELGHLLAVRWTFLSPLVLALVLGAVLWPVGRGRRSRSRTRSEAAGRADDAGDPAPDEDLTRVERFLATPRGRAAAILTGLAIGGGVILARALSMMGSILAISQTYDNVFHLNAVRHILRHGDGSAWVVGGMTALPGNESYYPSLWHQAVSLVVQLSGQEIILASNVLMLLVAVVVWPVGLVTLVRTCTSSGPLGWMVAGALAGVTAAFPLSLMSWGLLLPYFLSMALMPLVITAIAHLAGVVPAARRLSPGQLAVLLPAACGAAALAHPQGVFVGMVLGLPILVWATLLRGRDLLARVPGAWARLWPLATLSVVAVAGSAAVWTRLRPSQGSAVWEPNASVQEALGQAVSLTPNATPAWLPLGLVMLGCAAAVLLGTRSRWLLAVWAPAVAMSVITRSAPVGDLRYLLTGPWYSDNYRVTAMIAVAAIPVLAVGTEVLLRRAARSLPMLRGAAVAVAVTLAVLALSLFSPSTQVNENLVAEWQSEDLLSDDERELLERLPEVVPEDAVIATNAWNGSSLAYAISDREVLNTYMGFQAEPEVHLLNAELDEARSNPEVCDAAEQLDVEYALDFGPQEIHGRSATYTGLNEISETGAAEVVLQVGDAKLLRMLPCRGTDGSMNR